MVLFATLAKDSETMLQELSVARLEVILKMNMTETHIMCNSTKCRVEVDEQILHYVNEYTYLGRIASFENRQQEEGRSKLIRKTNPKLLEELLIHEGAYEKKL